LQARSQASGYRAQNLLIVGSQHRGKATAIAFTLIETAKLKGICPQEWLTDVLSRIAEHKIDRIDELLLWNYSAGQSSVI